MNPRCDGCGRFVARRPDVPDDAPDRLKYFWHVVYDDYAVDGDVTTVKSKLLAPGFSVVTMLQKKGPGVFKLTHTFTSTLPRWIKFCKRLQDGTGAASRLSDEGDHAAGARDARARQSGRHVQPAPSKHDWPRVVQRTGGAGQ